jgi:hypothetical protein
MKNQAAPEESTLRMLDRWWFGYGSPTTLGVFRILIGMIVILDLFIRASDWEAWFGEYGFVPAWLGRSWLGNVPLGSGDFSLPRLSLISGVTDPRIAIAFFALVTVAAVTTTLGIWTRFSAFLLAMGIVSLHHRNSGVLHGGDTALRIAVLYLAVSPCGRACSLDRLMRLRRGEETGQEEISLWPQRLVQFNLAIIYFTTVWLKFFGGTWLNGTAAWYPPRLAEFKRFPVPGFLNEMPFVYVATYGTLLTEFALATLVFFRPLRNYVVLAGIFLHAYIEYSMNIPLFSFLMISFYVCHFQGEEISAYAKRLGERLRGKLGLEVHLPKGAKLTVAGECFLKAVDPLGLVRYSASSEETWSADKMDGKKANPFRAAAFRSPGAWIFLLVPGLWRRTMAGCAEAAA